VPPSLPEEPRIHQLQAKSPPTHCFMEWNRDKKPRNTCTAGAVRLLLNRLSVSLAIRSPEPSHQRQHVSYPLRTCIFLGFSAPARDTLETRNSPSRIVQSVVYNCTATGYARRCLSQSAVSGAARHRKSKCNVTSRSFSIAIAQKINHLSTVC
jgi:hypothetical protein